VSDSKLAFRKAAYQKMEGKYTTIGSQGIRGTVLVKSIKEHLASDVGRTLGGLQDEANYAIPSCIGECNEWTPIQFYPTALRVISLLSGRIFVGLPLCRDEEWIDATINYTNDAVNAIAPVKAIHPLLRPFIAPRLPEVRRIKQHRINGARLLEPVLVERLENMKAPGFKPPTDMIQFMLQNSGEKAGDVLFQSYMQMSISMAAIHTTAMNMTQIIYNLASYPEYQEPLRREVEEALAADNGIITKAGMTKLRKMDSFVRESQRMNPAGASLSHLFPLNSLVRLPLT
jgi:ent-kaurene oxidase